MADQTQELQRALTGDRVAVAALIRRLTPVIQARVARALMRRRSQALGRDVRQELADLSQEVLMSLFEANGRVLRGWQETRGLSLESFVGLVSERQAASILRTGRRSPWTEDPTFDDDLVSLAGATEGPELQVASRELLEAVLDHVRCALSPQGLHLFYALIVEQRPIEELGRELEMTRDALYAWKSRLTKLVRKFADELEGAGEKSFAAGE